MNKLKFYLYLSLLKQMLTLSIIYYRAAVNNYFIAVSFQANNMKTFLDFIF